jgi:hypothetical protein
MLHAAAKVCQTKFPASIGNAALLPLLPLLLPYAEPSRRNMQFYHNSHLYTAERQ